MMRKLRMQLRQSCLNILHCPASPSEFICRCLWLCTEDFKSTNNWALCLIDIFCQSTFPFLSANSLTFFLPVLGSFCQSTVSCIKCLFVECFCLPIYVQFIWLFLGHSTMVLSVFILETWNLKPKGGGNTRWGWGGRGSQFGRLERKPCTLYTLWVSLYSALSASASAIWNADSSTVYLIVQLLVYSCQ